MGLRNPWGVEWSEVLKFVEENPVVASYLGKFTKERRKGRRSSWAGNAEVLCRYFKWLRMVKQWTVSPRELLNDHLRRLQSLDVEQRRCHVSLVLAFTRDNPHPYFQELSDSRKYYMYIVIKGFYDYHEVPLTTSKGKYGRRRKRKRHPKQIALPDAKKILGVVSQRERAILMITLQSGLEIGAVIYKFGNMWSHIKEQLALRKERIKIEIDERKGNGKWYYTYISRDAIHELKNWLLVRRKIVAKAKERFGYVDPDIEEGKPIFITKSATPYGEDNFQQNYLYALRKQKMKQKAGEKVSHMFRKLFKSEASVPDRGIDRNIVEFWLGRAEAVDQLDATGGIYDRNPEIREDVVEREYEKLEPYINIYTGTATTTADPLFQDLQSLSENFPEWRRFLSDVVVEAKAKLAEKISVPVE